MPDRHFDPLTCEQLLALRDDEREELARYVEIINHDYGSSSPAESFISMLVMQHTNGHPLTPDDVLDNIADFKQEFEMAITAARHMGRQYPKLVSAAHNEKEV